MSDKFRQDLTQGSVGKQLIKFSIPFLLSNLLQAFYSVADMIIVGRLCGTHGITGVNIGSQINILVTGAAFGLAVGGTVLIAQYGGGFVISGNPVMAALGVFLLVFGNLFNLVISLLGAYIHDARLQYVEFYGRFFEGEGELFTPLGSKHKYVYLLPTGEQK